MPPIINAQGLAKRYGRSPLFENLSFTVSEGDRIGLIGPNGSGKSTLLEILCGRIRPDSGEVARRKRTTFSYVAQISEFAPGQTPRSVIETSLETAGVFAADRAFRTEAALDRAGFADIDADAASLSGGWRKRLAIAAGLAPEPDILLLDEPTNHLDLVGIEWLETLVQKSTGACVIVSHDRYFLENIAGEMVELSRLYAGGSLRVTGNYSKFLEAKEQYLHAQQKHQEALENRVHTEIEWLRRGTKARTTKSKARIDKAHEMIGKLAGLNARTRVTAAGIDFAATTRQTKQLIVLDGVTCALGGRTLFEKFNFTVTAGMRVGLVGPNGSGKTTLLRLLRGELGPTAGQVRPADALPMVYFDQNRALDPAISLRRALAPDSDSVIYQERVIHVAAWAARFLFSSDDLNRPVGQLSGGERARVLIAQLMLQPPGVLLLDEPTNDLDIPTLEILEESLLEYRGALVLVTHDRFMLDRVSNIVIGLDGLGHAERFASYLQWEAWLRTQQRKPNPGTPPTRSQHIAVKALLHSPAAAKTPGPAHAAPAVKVPATPKKKLTHSETREMATIEERIAAAEENLRAQFAAMADPSLLSDPLRLRRVSAKMEEARQAVDALIARWAELEQKIT
jgi:ATP-binding cassette subfamily F protein uup